VKSIELPDLVTAGSLAVNGITTLEKLSFPKLENIEHLSLWFSAMVNELEFPLLKNASEIQLNANFSNYCSFAAEEPRLTGVGYHSTHCKLSTARWKSAIPSCATKISPRKQQ
jgi:hypothetical protein